MNSQGIRGDAGRRTQTSVRKALGGTAAVLVAALAFAPSAGAATFEVTTLADSGTGSLRQAITDANNAPGADVITFQPGLTGTISLASALPNLSTDITIQGPGADLLTLRRDSGGTYSVLTVLSATVEVSGITISNGHASTGGGIASTGNLTVRRAVISNNQATFWGGGIRGGPGSVTVVASTIRGNTAGADGGGGVDADNLTIRNSTISGNTASNSGGAGGVWAGGVSTIESSTIAANTNTNALGAANLQNDNAGTLNLRSTIIAGPLGSGANCTGATTSQGFNLADDASCDLDQATDQESTDPKLDSPAANGGPTPTMRLAADSPAVDQGNAGALTTDQRGKVRKFDRDDVANAPGGDGSDIGAYELQHPKLVIDTADAGPGSLRQAILDANEDSGKDVIAFAPGVSGQIVLSTELPTLTDDVEIQGPGAESVTVRRASGAPDFRIFSIVGEGVKVTISGLTVENGRAPEGGGIANDRGVVVLDRLVVKNNHATGSDGGGGVYHTGAIWDNPENVARTIVRRSSIVDNSSAQHGGGLSIGQTGGIRPRLVIEDSLVARNVADGTGGGGGIASRPGPLLGESLTIVRNSTITANTAGPAEHGGGGGVRSTAGSHVRVQNSTVSGNSAPGDGANLAYAGGSMRVRSSIVSGPKNGSNCSSEAVVSYGFNLADDQSCSGFSQASDQRGVDPQLGPLADNGGPTQTMMPAPASPALDRGSAGPGSDVDFIATSEDQRGETRPVDLLGIPNPAGGDGADVGAVEIQVAEALAPSAAVTSGPSGATTNRSPEFGFQTQNAFAVECSIDAGTPSYGPCSAASSHAPAAPLALGTWTFRVRAVGATGQAATATRSFTISEASSPPSQPPTQPVDQSVSVQIKGKKLKLNRKGATTLRIACPASEASPPCQGKAVLRTAKKVRFRGKRRHVALAKAGFSAGAGETAKTKLTLGKRQRRLVAKSKVARRVRAIVTVRDQAGNTARQVKPMQLVPPK